MPQILIHSILFFWSTIKAPLFNFEFYSSRSICLQKMLDFMASDLKNPFASSLKKDWKDLH